MEPFLYLLYDFLLHGINEHSGCPFVTFLAFLLHLNPKQPDLLVSVALGQAFAIQTAPPELFLSRQVYVLDLRVDVIRDICVLL